MPAIEGFRSPYDKTAGGLHHLGRMIDKIRLMQAECLPEEFHRNYGLSVGLDGQLCGFLGLAFDAVEARVREGGAEAEIVEWIFSHGLRPNRTQAYIWNEHSRKLGWNDRLTPYMHRQHRESGVADAPPDTSFELIELLEGRTLPALREATKP